MRGCQGLGAAALLAAGALANTEMAQVDPSLCAPETNELVRQGPWYVGARYLRRPVMQARSEPRRFELRRDEQGMWVALHMPAPGSYQLRLSAPAPVCMLH